MGMRRLAACVLAAALALGGVATTLATPTVAEAYPQGATFPVRSKSDLSYYEKDKPVVLEAGKNYVLTGQVDIDYYKVQGGTAENPTRLYFSNDRYLGGPLTDMRNKTYYRRPLFVVTGGTSSSSATRVTRQRSFAMARRSWAIARTGMSPISRILARSLTLP